MRRQRGYILIQAVAAILIVLVAVMLAGMALQSRTKSTAAEKAQSVEATELVALGKALEQYMNWAGAAWQPGQVQRIPVGSLAAYGLEVGIGQHGGQDGVTPWMQHYEIRAMVTADGSVKGIVYDQGAPSAAILTRTGLTAGAMLLSKQNIAALVSKQGGVGATMDAGSAVAQGVNDAFQVSLGGFLSGAVPGHASAVALVGFSELEAPDPNDTPPPWVLNTKAKCNVSVATGSSDAICPAGTYKATQWPHCGWDNPDSSKTAYTAYATPVGPVTLGMLVQKTFFDPLTVGFESAPGNIGIPGWLTTVNDAVRVESQELVVNVSGAPIIVAGVCETTTKGLTRPSTGECMDNPPKYMLGTEACDISHSRSTVSGRDALCCAN